MYLIINKIMKIRSGSYITGFALLVYPSWIRSVIAF